MLILISGAFSYKDQIESNFFDLPLMFPKGEEIFCIPLSVPCWCGEPWDSYSVGVLFSITITWQVTKDTVHAQAFGNVSHQWDRWLNSQESPLVFLLLSDLGTRIRVRVHHCLPSPILTESDTAFIFCPLPFLSVLVDAGGKKKSSQEISIQRKWTDTQQQGPSTLILLPLGGLYGFMLAPFSFSKGWERAALLPCWS